MLSLDVSVINACDSSHVSTKFGTTVDAVGQDSTGKIDQPIAKTFPLLNHNEVGLVERGRGSAGA
jgi:hypothetical protein